MSHQLLTRHISENFRWGRPRSIGVDMIDAAGVPAYLFYKPLFLSTVPLQSRVDDAGTAVRVAVDSALTPEFHGSQLSCLQELIS